MVEHQMQNNVSSNQTTFALKRVLIAYEQLNETHPKRVSNATSHVQRAMEVALKASRRNYATLGQVHELELIESRVLEESRGDGR